MSDGRLVVNGLGIEDFTEWEGKRSPLKAIREKCLDCSNDQRDEVKFCQVKKCPLYPFRIGKNPFAAKRVMTEEQRKAASKRLSEMREKRNQK